MKPSELREWVVPGLMVAGGLILLDQVAELFGDGQSDENLEDLPYGNPTDQDPTLPHETFIVYADGLDEALLQEFGEDEDYVYAVMGQMRNDADVYALMHTFGVRCVLFNAIQCYTLPSAIVAFMSSGERSNINDILAGNGLTLRF